MRFSTAALILSVAAGAGTGGAFAQDVATAADPQSIAAQLQALGYEARLEPYESGRPRVKSRIVGVNYSLAFYGCLDDMTDCRGLMFTAGFDMNDPVDWTVVNDWNETRVYTRAFIDKDGDPFVQMPVANAMDLNAAEVTRMIDIWESALVKFTDTIGFNRPEETAGAPATGQPVATAQPPATSLRVGPKKAPSASALSAEDQ